MSFFFVRPNDLNGEPIGSRGLKDIDPAGLHGGSRVIPMLTGPCRVTGLTEATRAGPHSPSFVIPIEEHVSFKTNEPLSEILCPLPSFQPSMKQDRLSITIDHPPGDLWSGCMRRTAEAPSKPRAPKLTLHPHPLRGHDRTGVNDLRSIEPYLCGLLTVVLQRSHDSLLTDPSSHRREGRVVRDGD